MSEYQTKFVPANPCPLPKPHCRIAWFRGLTWGYMGLRMRKYPEKISIEFDWTPDKKYAVIFDSVSAEKRMAKYPNEKLELVEVL